MALVLERSSNHIPVLFLDDQLGLQGQMVQGLKVYAPDELLQLKQRFHLHEILLAIPSIDVSKNENYSKAGVTGITGARNSEC